MQFRWLLVRTKWFLQ